MHSKEKVNCKQKRLLDTSFIQNDKKMSTLLVSHPDKMKRTLVFTTVFDVVLTKTGQM